MKASILTIGDELLMGQVIDTNSSWLGQQLNQNGIKVIARLSVGDDKEEIKRGLHTLENISELILITGGLGPTKDDITKNTLAEYFGLKMVLNKEVLNDVTGFFARLKRPLLESNLKQAEVPEGCEVIRNRWGTAPAMWFQKEEKNFVSMPGVPNEMKNLITHEVMPRIKSRLKTEFILHHTIITAGIGESFLAELIKDFENELPTNFKLAYLPNLSQVRLRLTASSDDESALKKTMQQRIEKLKGIISIYIFGEEEDSLESVIGEMLLARNQTVCTAESCTGGFIAHKITSIPGSSRYFPGSAVAYSYQMKSELLNVKKETLELYGAVSEETVKEMSEGALKNFHTDYAIAVSGIAGPDGGTTEKPVGTVWVAIRTKEKVFTECFHFFRDRMQNIEMTSVAALNLLRKVMNRQLV